MRRLFKSPLGDLGVNLSRYISALVVLFSITNHISAQSAEAVFGQNRVQYKDFAFQYYESDHFITYFYPGGQDIAKYVIKSAEDNALYISEFLNYKYRGKINIIIYNTINELNQTNIGIYNSDADLGTSFKLPESKIFIYFNGDHAYLDKQVKEGIARIYVDKTKNISPSSPSGGGSADKPGMNGIINTFTFKPPDWYSQGLISYLSEPWNADMEDRLRDGIMTGRYQRLNKLSPEETKFIGHAIWHYVEEVYGKNATSNLQYLCRINKSVDNGFYFALGTNLNETLQAWYKYYASRYNNEIKYTIPYDKKDLVKKRYRKETDYYEPRISPDGRYIAYASNNLNRLKIHLMDLEKKKKKVVFRSGWRTTTQWTDESTPLIAWNPKGDKLGFVFDRKNIVRFGEYRVAKEKHKPRKEFHRIEKFSKITSFTYADAKTLAMAAIRNGQSDICLYTIASQTVKQITDDFYDDFTPAVVMVDSIRGVVFASNRGDDTLRKEKYDAQVFDKQTDLFFYDLDDESHTLYRITNTPNANESYPQPFNDEYFSYLSESNGIRNRHLATLEQVFDHNQKNYHFHDKESNEDDSISLPENMDYTLALDTSIIQIKSVTKDEVYRTQGKTYQLSNFSSNIMEQSLAVDKNLALDRVLKKGRFEFYKYEINTAKPDLKNTYIQTDYIKRRNNIMLSEDSAKKVIEDKKRADIAAKENHIITKVYTGQDFQSEYDYGVKLFDWDSAAAAHKATIPNATTGASTASGFVFRYSQIRPYFVRFMVDNFVGQLNNDPLVTMYQPFNPQNPGYMYQPLNALFKVGITDLLEDYKIYGGITLPLAGAAGFSFSDLGYFLVYENLKKRWDKKYTFYYQGMSSTATTAVPFYNTPIPDNVGGVDYSVKTAYLSAEYKYPFDVFHRIGLTGGFRNDRYVFKSLDTFSLHLPTYSTNWVFFRGEYVYDNTIDVMTNIKNGFRAKAFFEFHKEFPTQEQDGVKLPAWNNSYFTEMGFDARYYLKIYKQMILASRASFATSLGNNKMIHYLGGLDNSLLSIQSGNHPAVQAPIANENFVYQTVESPMRGFTANSRNGSSYALVNAELRIPFITMLMNHPSKSEIIRNFMIVGFLDCGTAWDGLSPFSNNNPLFSTTYTNPVSVVTVQQYKTPVILGTGFGFRTSLLGYFVKLDVAWGLDTGIWSDKPIYYLSFGHDF